jgi:hypothetical protein
MEPLSRELFEYVQQIQPNENLFRYLTDRSNIRQMTGSGLKPAYIESTDPVVRDARLLIYLFIHLFLFFFRHLIN